jgi:hypothetical protein
VPAASVARLSRLGYLLSTEDIAGVVRTFRSVFPSACGWVTGYDLVLVGGDAPLGLDPDAIARRMEHEPIRSSLASVAVDDVEDLLGCWFAGPETLRALADRAPRPITDDRPWIEFTAPLSAGRGYAVEILRQLAESGEPVPLLPAATPEARSRIAAVTARLRHAAREFAVTVERDFTAARHRYTGVLLQ